MELPERPGAAMDASKSVRERHLGGQDGQLGAQVAPSWRPGGSEIPRIRRVPKKRSQIDFFETYKR